MIERRHKNYPSFSVAKQLLFEVFVFKEVNQWPPFQRPPAPCQTPAQTFRAIHYLGCLFDKPVIGLLLKHCCLLFPAAKPFTKSPHLSALIPGGKEGAQCTRAKFNEP